MSSRGVSLYRSILRAHKQHLPHEMKQLGDTYVKAEFRLHKKAKPEHLTGFFREWEKYLDQLMVTARARGSLSSGSVDQDDGNAAATVFAFGSDLQPDIELSQDQLQQLEKLREETENVGQPGRS